MGQGWLLKQMEYWHCEYRAARAELAPEGENALTQRDPSERGGISGRGGASIDTSGGPWHSPAFGAGLAPEAEQA